jgi:hypothetical protein
MKNEFKNNLALMAIAFDFFGQLDEEQLNDLVEGRASLRLQTTEDMKFEAMINEKLGNIDEKLVVALKTVVESYSEKSVAHASEPKAKTDRKSQRKPETVAEKPAEPSKPVKPTERRKPLKLTTEEVESVTSAIKNISAPDELEKYLDENNFKRFDLQRIASALDIKGTAKGSGDDIKKMILAAIF